MLIQQLLLHTCLRKVELERMEVHKRNFFQNNGVMNRLVCILAPSERAVAVNEDAGIAAGSLPWNASTITLPVSFSYSPAISSEVISCTK